MLNPYRVLGVSSLDTKNHIKSEYKRLSKIYHPDNIKTGNEVKFKQINDAWSYIEKYHNDTNFKNVVNNGRFTHVTLFKIRRV